MTALVRFTVSAPNPDTHLFCVRMEIDGLAGEAFLDVSMPVWTPGSYLVREYARHVQHLQVRDGDGNARTAQKTDKATWRVECADAARLVLEYEVFAHDLTVRTNHLDDSHGFFTSAALLLYPQGRLHEASELAIEPPDGWEVFCPLPAVEGAENVFRAENFDVLFDTPVEIGPHDSFEFEVEGRPHRVVIWGGDRYDRDRLAADLTQVVEANSAMFGGLPYDDYLFIVHLTDSGYGGLEHLNSTVLQFTRAGLAESLTPPSTPDAPRRPEGKYVEFLRLACHEHFHVWNVKRIRPAVLGPFDYQNENYTRELWSIEGVTSYYDTFNVLRSGLIDARKYLDMTARRIKSYHDVPGRHVHSLEEASFDAWIKLYRPDENTANSSVSYYLKGELVCLALDLWIRDRTDGARSLDDVLRVLWQQYLDAPLVGYPEGVYEELVRQVAERDPTEFFARYVRGTDEIDWDEVLAPVGLRLQVGRDGERRRAWLGCTTRGEGDRAVVSFVPTASPAAEAGVYAGDEIVAVGGIKATQAGLSDVLKAFEPGATVAVHLFRRGLLLERRITLGAAPADHYRIELRDDASDRARALLRGWLGSDTFDSDTSGSDDMTTP